MKRIDVPVLIVGAGPTGLTAALLFSRMGVKCHLIERRPGPQRAPAAHAVNARTFEIFRQAGVDMNAVAAVARDPRDAGTVYWVDKLGGEIIGRLPYERQGEDMLAVTPTPLRNLSQHRLEPVLVDALHAAGVDGPCYGHQWECTQQSGDGVLSRIRRWDTGETYEVRSRYLLAADGAGSRVRRWADIAMVGPDRLQSFVMIHFRADLRAVVRDCPGIMYWICNPSAGGILVAHDIDREWVYMHPWDPDSELIDHYDEATCETLVRRALADPMQELSISTISGWTMTAQIAERYRHDRIFLVGDAAHRFPPTGGLGLNTGVQDAHNLAWKIAAVESGRAGQALLDTYEAERRSIAQQNGNQSFGNAVRLLEVQQALGVLGDPDTRMEAYRHALTDADARRALETAIAGQAEHFDMPGLQLGFRYDSGALVPDDASPPLPAASVRDFVPSSAPGSRLPHGWVLRDGERISTLDLVSPAAFTLFLGPSAADCEQGADAAIRCVRIGVDIDDSDDWWGGAAGMNAAGMLLVRPDQHVAWRCNEAAAPELERIVAAVLGRTADARETLAYAQAL